MTELFKLMLFQKHTSINYEQLLIKINIMKINMF